MSLGRSNSTGVLAAGKRRPRPLKIGGGASRLSAIELSSVEDVIGGHHIANNLYVYLNKFFFMLFFSFNGEHGGATEQ